VLAATNVSAAEAFAREHSFDPATVISRADLIANPRELRTRLRQLSAAGAIVHSSDWRRQQNPHLYELALALMPVRERLIIDHAEQKIHTRTRRGAACRAALLPAHVAQVAGVVTAEWLTLRRGRARRPHAFAGNTQRSLLAIWPASGERFGGSITHITGILGAFRRAGFRVGLLTTGPLPEQVRQTVDDFEVMPALSTAARLTGDTAQICSNRPMRKAGMRLAERLGPAFVYQRHSPFLLAGVDLARHYGIPLALEWNSSEVWIRDNWQTTLPIERILDPFLVATERAVVREAAVIAAVSHSAAEMAAQAGATEDRLLVLPNAVDIAYVDSHLNGHGTRDAREPSTLLGWAGSFGPWHGAEVIVKALDHLPTAVRLVMIGDGDERRSCEALAENLGVFDRIEWTGAISRPEALHRLSQCDVLVSPHTPLPGRSFFGSPTKLFEYMALGKPIVASRLGQMGELLEDGVTAHLVTPGDVDELSAAILQILASPDRGRTLGEAARRDVETNHTWDHRARSLLERMAI
jgi:glycosyltransferase involved in cell wall biosynthesis